MWRHLDLARDLEVLMHILCSCDKKWIDAGAGVMELWVGLLAGNRSISPTCWYRCREIRGELRCEDSGVGWR